MKLVRQTRLIYTQGRSDKVYEVDLCHLRDDEWVVNFRYGRRGATLRDGTKTTLPVTREKAEQIFDKLVASKAKKGYVDEQGPALDPVATLVDPVSASRVEAEGRDARILQLLETARDKRDWPLDRVIWRAGELRLHAAVPHLLQLLGHRHLSDLRGYCLAWSLARCAGSDDTAARQAMLHLLEDERRGARVRRIALQGALLLATEKQRQEMFDDIVERLPRPIRDALDDAEALHRALRTFLDNVSGRTLTLLEELYVLAFEHETARSALLSVVAEAPLRPPWFRHLRHLFKAAELRDDAEMFGLSAYRFETTKAMVNNHGWSRYAVVGRDYVRIAKEIVKDDSRVGYTSRTRDYLRRRTERRLRVLGSDADPAYVPMAVGVLLAFSDKDEQAPRRTEAYSDGYITHHFDAWAPYLALNLILYGNSPRYRARKGRPWACRDPYRPGNPPPAEREEMFPELWDAQPVGLVHLLAESRAEVVHQFAVKALVANTAFCKQLDAEVLGVLLGRPYEVTLRFALDLARELYRPEAPDFALVRALLDADLEAARVLARAWVDAHRAAFMVDEDFVVAIVLSRFADLRTWACDVLGDGSFTEEREQALVARLLAHLMALSSEEDEALAGDVCRVLSATFSERLAELHLATVIDLIEHSLAPARGFGLRLFSGFSSDVLLRHSDLLIACVLSAKSDVRTAVRPAVLRLAAENTDFEVDLAHRLIPFLLREEAHEGLHGDVFVTVSEALPRAVEGLDQDTVWFLVASRYRGAGELAKVYFQRHVNAADLSFPQLVELAGHEILALREFAWDGYRRRASYLPHEMPEALGILDSSWPDSRRFAIRYFKEHGLGNSELWDPGLLVSVCDSVREDVAAFGRELITHYFKDADGPEYLLKLSQHPTSEMQTFATNYLERYAAGDLAQLHALRHYFVSVLARVGRGRVAKDRVLGFLHREALENREAAELVGEILVRQSATLAIGDKAAALAALRDIHRAWPDLDLPLTLKAPARWEAAHVV